MKICIIIPIFNHHTTIEQVIVNITVYDLPCIIVDDGSDEKTKIVLNKIVKKYPYVTLVTQSNNQGKGSAIKFGFEKANELGYTHALQIDADNQHDSNDIPKFIEQINKNENQIISGLPIYDNSIPKSRLYGRKITNFWVIVQTWTTHIQESMCGYRIYPIRPTLEVIYKYNVGLRMDFDIEILVRSYWSGLNITYIKTKVIYPQKGISHFKMFRDNLLISKMHTILFFGMLKRIPSLVTRKQNISQKKINKHWSKLAEKGSLIGLRSVLLIYKLAGRRITNLLLYPIITYFYIFSSTAKNASKQYLGNLNAITGEKQSSIKHFFSFGQSAFDKLSVWNDDIKIDQINFPTRPLFIENMAQKKGGVIFTAHLGNIEIARALSQFDPKVKINAIVFSQNAQKFNSILEKISPSYRLTMIEVTSMDLTLAMVLKDKVDAGEFIIIVADRTSTSQPGRSTKAMFLNKEADFPQGPFILASLLQCPAYFMLCLKEPHNKYRMVFELFSDNMYLKRKDRDKQLTLYTQKYANLLEQYCQEYPLQWFNFFDFWKPNTNRDKK